MRVARYTAYGGPETVVIEDAPIPTPKPGEVLVRVQAAPVTAGDARMRSGKVPRGMGLILRLVIGLRRPKNAPGWAFSIGHPRVTGIPPGALRGQKYGLATSGPK